MCPQNDFLPDIFHPKSRGTVHAGILPPHGQWLFPACDGLTSRMRIRGLQEYAIIAGMSETTTDTQAAFISALVLEGCPPTEAARRAGYAQPKQRAHELLRKPHIIYLIRQEQARVITGDLTNLALRTLRRVMDDAESAPSAKVSACRAVLEASGYFKKEAPADAGTKNPFELTRAELQDMVANMKAQLEQQRGTTIGTA